LDTLLIKEKFEKIGAGVRFSELTDLRINDDPSAVVIDVMNSKKGGIFDIKTRGRVDLSVPDIQAKDRHLLLMAKIFSEDRSLGTNVIKTLCGHDEREFFAAQVPGRNLSNVFTAKQALKPELAVLSQKMHRVKTKHLHRRKNRGFVRQGEWFFVPAEGLNVNENMIQRPKGGEPIVLAGERAGNKPHRAKEAYIKGGTRVYIARAPGSEKISRDERRRLSTGLTEDQKAEFIKRYPKAKSWSWAPMTRNPELYVRGWIRHPDHKTIILRDWHRVAVNGEIRGGHHVVFLD